jgi:hypothetical protein
MSGGSGTYVYCVVVAPRRPALPRRAAGLPRTGRPRLLEITGGVWAVAAGVPLAIYGEDQLRDRLTDLDWVSTCAVAHEQLVGAMLEAGVVIPMKLFTLYKSDDRAVADLAGRAKDLVGAAKRLAGCEEWGLRVQVDAARALTSARPKVRTAVASGTAFLQQKQARQQEAREAQAEGRRQIEELFTSLTKLARAARRHAPKSDELARVAVLDAAFLVPVARRKRFRDVVSRTSRALARAPFDIALTGPWAPYNFIEEEA